jgi:hypothetical protein
MWGDWTSSRAFPCITIESFSLIFSLSISSAELSPSSIVCRRARPKSPDILSDPAKRTNVDGRNVHLEGRVKVMELLGHLNWQELLVPKHSIVEMLVRGTIMYLALFFILRFVARCQFR